MQVGTWDSCLTCGFSPRRCSYRSSSFPPLGTLRAANTEGGNTDSDAIAASLQGPQLVSFFMSSGVKGVGRNVPECKRKIKLWI